MKIKNHKDLRIWQMGVQIVNHVYRLTDNFPKTEMFCLTDQMRRAAISIPSNISEGFPRQHKKEYRHFLSIALGSCSELQTQLTIAKNRNYIAEKDFKILEDMLDHEYRMITKLLSLF